MNAELLPADELIARTRRVYAECTSYADEGEQSTQFVHADPAHAGHASAQTFRTRWKRPDSFLFEFRHRHLAEHAYSDHYVIWSTSEGVRTWWTTQPHIDTRTSIMEAVAIAAGVSGGTSWFVPELLIGTPSGNGVPTVARGFFGERAELDGAECLRIPMQVGEDTRRRLWIDTMRALVVRLDQKRRHTREGRQAQTERALRRLSSDASGSGLDEAQRASMLAHFREQLAREFHEFTTETTTLYRPSLDVELAAETFAFEPPAPA